MNDKHVLTEVFGVRDIFVSGLGSVENIGGGCFRFTMFSVQEMHGKQEMVVVAKIIMAAEAIPEAMHMAATATNTCACQNARVMTRN